MFRLTTNGGLTATTGRDVDEEIERLERLVADLKAIRAGKRPTEDGLLQDAPGIDHWSKEKMSVPCLVGRALGHPRLGSQPIRTSDVWIMAEDYGCARTLSRWYVLGRPFEATLSDTKPS